MGLLPLEPACLGGGGLEKLVSNAGRLISALPDNQQQFSSPSGLCFLLSRMHSPHQTCAQDCVPQI